jgi:lipopolysaccharide export system permease protein
VTSVINRYLSREIFQTLVGVILVLLLIFLSNRLVRYLAEAAAGQLPADVIFTLVALKTVKYLILLLPLALYLAVLLVLGRLYRDSEMAALAACGVGTMRLYRPVLYLALPLVLAQGWFSLNIVPWADAQEARIIGRAQEQMDISAVSPGRFREGRQGVDGRRVIYAQAVDADGQLRKVFIQVREANQNVLLSAERGHVEQDPRTGNRYLVLVDGYRYHGEPGSPEFRILHFARHGILLRAGDDVQGHVKLNAVPTSELWGSHAAAEQAELQWRLSIPIATLALALLALPLGRVSPRKSNYGRLLIAVVVYVVYFNLLALAQTWTEKGQIPPMLGLWWVHGLMLVLVGVLLVRQSGLAWVLRSLRGGVVRPS